MDRVKRCSVFVGGLAMKLRSMTLAPVMVAALSLLPPAVSLAHDFWIEPLRGDPGGEKTIAFRPSNGETVFVRLRVGEHFVGKPYRRNPPHIEKFVLVGPDGTKDVRGRQFTQGKYALATADRPKSLSCFATLTRVITRSLPSVRYSLRMNGRNPRGALVTLCRAALRQIPRVISGDATTASSPTTAEWD